MQLRTSGVTVAALALGLSGAPDARALSLADLDAGAILMSLDGGITFSGFDVKIKGKDANDNLGDYEVTAVNGGFTIDLTAGTGGKISLKYQAETSGEIVGAGLSLSGADGKSKAEEKLKADGHKLGKLKAAVGDPDWYGFDPYTLLDAKEKVALKSALAGVTRTFDQTGVSATTTPVPEPVAFLLLAPLGLLLLSSTTRRA